MKVFISHSSKNADAALKICEKLEAAGHSCFIAPRDIRSGHEYAEEIIDGIDSCGVLLLLLSQDANSSPHVLREVERAVSKKINIVVFKLEAVELSKSMEYFLMTHQWINEKLDKSYDDIVSCINKLENEHSESAEAGETITPVPAKKSPLRYIIFGAGAVCLCALAVVLAVALKPADVPSADENTTASVTENVTENTVNTTAEETSSQTEKIVLTSTNAETEAALSTNAETLPPKTEEAEKPAPKYKAGDRVTFGEYLGEPIEWRIIGISEDGKEGLLLSDKILTMKAFDAAEGGKYNFYQGQYYWGTPADELDPELERQLRGDNRWELSNIRAWLNSDRENVKYSDQEPAAKAMSELKNGYNTEAGFLKSFTERESEAILTSSVVTDGVTTEDKVFLLSAEELDLLENADVSIYAVPTEAAKEQDGSAWYQLDLNDYGVTDHFWWLRNADPARSSQVYLVNNSYTGDKILSESAGLEGFGIRPAMRVDLTKF